MAPQVASQQVTAAHLYSLQTSFKQLAGYGSEVREVECSANFCAEFAFVCFTNFLIVLKFDMVI